MKRIFLILFTVLLGSATALHAQTIMQWAGADPVIGPSYRTTSTPVLGGELVDTWTNRVASPYETLTQGTGGLITQGINAAAAFGICYKDVSLVGKIIKYSDTITVTSGETPFLRFLVSGIDGSTVTTLLQGSGSGIALAAATSGAIGFVNGNATEFSVSQFSARQYTLSSLLAPTRPFSLGTSGGRFYWTPTTANCAAGEWLGAWVCGDDLRNPTKGLQVVVDRATGNLVMRALTAGSTWSAPLLNTAITFSSGARALLVVDTSNPAAPFAQCFYGNATVGGKIDLTAYSSWINSGRRHALFSTAGVQTSGPLAVTYDFGQIVLAGEIVGTGLCTTAAGPNNYDTFDGVSATGFHAISDGSAIAAAGTSDEIAFTVGGIYKLTYTATLTGGEAPVYNFRTAVFGTGVAEPGGVGFSASAGSNRVYAIATTTTIGVVEWRNTAAAAEYTLSGISFRRVQ